MQDPVKRNARLTRFSSCTALFLKDRNDNKSTSATFSKNKFLMGHSCVSGCLEMWPSSHTFQSHCSIFFLIVFLMTETLPKMPEIQPNQ